MLKALAFLTIIAASLTSAAFLGQSTTNKLHPYYGKKFYEQVYGKQSDDELKLALHKIISGGHIASDREESSFDEIVDSCETVTTEKKCKSHVSLGYDRARQFIFGKFYIVQLDASNYGIKEMYCNRIYQNEDFKSGKKPAPGVIPDNTIINVEHTWPQSKFTGKYSKEMQKSDLHHLFPTDSVMNSLRGNKIFGEVEHDEGNIKCSASRNGVGSAGGTDVFEPPTEHKGDVARALFYFAVRYKMDIREEEEVILKKWNREHPVDEMEASHNEEVAKIQGNRNPFVDHPELADMISNF